MTTLDKIRTERARGYEPMYIRVQRPESIKGTVRHVRPDYLPQKIVVTDDNRGLWDLKEGEFDVLCWRLARIVKHKEN